MKRTVKDVMTREVVVARDSWPFKDIARHLSAAGVSALPVVDDQGRIVGVVSESDLLVKEQDAERAGTRAFLGRRRSRRERRKAAGRVVRELMSTPAITVGPDETLAIAARRMHEHGVKRLPVVDSDGLVLGIVSRQDLLKIFLQPDEQIQKEIVRDVIQRALWIDPRTVRVVVSEGVVTLEGRIERKTLAEILIKLVRSVDGVVDVVDRLTFEFDDTRMRPVVPMPWEILLPGSSWPFPRAKR